MKLWQNREWEREEGREREKRMRHKKSEKISEVIWKIFSENQFFIQNSNFRQIHLYEK